MKSIKPWYEPTDILRKLPRDKWHALMTRENHGFLSGIIRDFRPKKILELGIAFGGTSALIIKSLELSGIECEMHSIDLNHKFREKETGYMIKNINLPSYIKHSLTIGKVLKDQIEEIGGDIDLVILDTTHNIPGEILEFLIVLPFMSKDGVVVIHDVAFNNELAAHKRNIGRSLRKICPKVLFSTVTAEKYYNISEMRRRGGHYNLEISNIAAFKINGSTYENIEDLFFSLSHTWYDDWSKEELDSYRQFLSKYYSPKCMMLWDLIINNQQDYKENIAFVRKYLSRLDSYSSKIENLKNRLATITGLIKK